MSTNAMHVAKTGLNAQQVRMQIISNNLANVNTNGFKRDRANFESLIRLSEAVVLRHLLTLNLHLVFLLALA